MKAYKGILYQVPVPLILIQLGTLLSMPTLNNYNETSCFHF